METGKVPGGGWGEEGGARQDGRRGGARKREGGEVPGRGEEGRCQAGEWVGGRGCQAGAGWEHARQGGGGRRGGEVGARQSGRREGARHEGGEEGTRQESARQREGGEMQVEGGWEGTR